jgi:hypothetical protein
MKNQRHNCISASFSLLSVHFDDLRGVGAAGTRTPVCDRVRSMSDFVRNTVNTCPVDLIVLHGIRPNSYEELRSSIPSFEPAALPPMPVEREAKSQDSSEALFQSRFGAATADRIEADGAMAPSPQGNDMAAFLQRSDSFWHASGVADAVPLHVELSPRNSAARPTSFRSLRVSAPDFRLPPSTDGADRVSLERYFGACRQLGVDVAVGHLHLQSREVTGGGYRDALLDSITAGGTAADADTRSFVGETNDYFSNARVASNRFHRCVYRRRERNTLRPVALSTMPVFESGTSGREATSLRPILVRFDVDV